LNFLYLFVNFVLQAVVDYEGIDATLNILKNLKNELKAIFFRDKEIQRIFSLCHEVLFVDAIYKVNDLIMPLYVFFRYLSSHLSNYNQLLYYIQYTFFALNMTIVIDSNGLNEILGF
jgi:hypothetical protein